MLILRGIANAENPSGRLDNEAALEYAHRLGFQGEVLDFAGDTEAGSPQVDKALERIRTDDATTAIYGFSGGGYNARLIWKKLTPADYATLGDQTSPPGRDAARARFFVSKRRVEEQLHRLCVQILIV